MGGVNRKRRAGKAVVITCCRVTVATQNYSVNSYFDKIAETINEVQNAVNAINTILPVFKYTTCEATAPLITAIINTIKISYAL